MCDEPRRLVVSGCTQHDRSSKRLRFQNSCVCVNNYNYFLSGVLTLGFVDNNFDLQFFF